MTPIRTGTEPHRPIHEFAGRPYGIGHRATASSASWADRASTSAKPNSG